jgi:hypothetical protein
VLLWLRSYAFTFIVEAPVFIALSRRYVPAWRGCLAGMAGTAFTHPLLWFVWAPLVVGGWRRLAQAAWFTAACPDAIQGLPAHAVYVFTGELLVSLCESLTFFALARPIPFWRAVAASFLANAASYGLGSLLRAFGVW